MNKLVSVSKSGFVLCRYTLAILIWTSFIFKIKWLMVLSLIFFISSSILRIKNSPIIFLYENTFNKIIPSKREILNENAMRFAHLGGTFLSGICVIFLYSPFKTIGWIFVGFFAILKTISAIGFCPASKLYSCMSSGGCCALTSKK